MSGNFSKSAAPVSPLAEQFRRTDPRFDRRIDVQVTAGAAQHSAVSRNISLGGMFIDALEPLPLLTKVTVRFRVPTQNQLIEVTGEVRWVEQGSTSCGIGIRFDGLRAREVWALNRYFQT